MDGILIVGHGTRDRGGLAEFRTVVDEVARQAGDRVVEPCFLELAEPPIAEGVRRAVERGVSRLSVMPLLLFAAGHAKRDIPEALATEAARHPDLEIRQTPPLESHPAILDLSLERYQAALVGRPPIPASETLLLMVGRGSNDPEANAEMARFARLRYEGSPVGWLETCFIAMTEPKLEQSLEVAAQMPFRRVVVQPHLLFCGELLEKVRRAVETTRSYSPNREWLVTDHLGPNPLMAAAILELAEAKAVSVPPLARRS
jgi:sirohydrochlorin cobaltochelatase